MFRKIIFCGILLINFSSAIGQVQPKDSATLDNVLVQTGTGIEVNRNKLPLSVTVISRKQLDESSESALLPILNGRVPGLFVTERGVTGFGVAENAGGQITIRGVGENPTTGVLILIDGHPQFMGIMGHPLADSYIASSTEKVEIIRGAASVLYGTNAMGGVINIITRKNEQEGWQANGRVMFGSFNTQKYMASAGYRKKKFSFFVSGNHDQTDGHRANSDFEIDNGYIKLGYTINKHLNVQADFSLANFKTTDPGPDTLHAIPGSSLNITRGYAALGLSNTFKNFSGMAKFYYNFGVHDISDGFHSTDNNYGLNLSETLKLLQGNAITVGTDIVRYGGKANTMAGAMVIPFVDTTVNEEALYILLQQSIIEKLNLTAGLRYQHHNVYGGQWIPSGGISIDINDANTLRASVSKGFRSPTIRELFMFNHNPFLSPEHVVNYEIAMQQFFAKRKLRVELTAFKVTGNNIILTDNFGKLYNGGVIKNSGVEFTADFLPGKKFSGNIVYSYTHMQSPQYATPQHHLFTGGNYHCKKMDFYLNVNQIYNLNTQVTPTLPAHMENYILLNAKASWNILKKVQLFAAAENLLNQRYETLRYYTMPGTTISGGINIKL